MLVDRLLDGSQGISSTLLPAPLAALVRKSLEARYRDALVSHEDTLENAAKSAAFLDERNKIYNEVAELFIRRLRNLLVTDSVPSELVIAILHPSVKRSGRPDLRRPQSDWPKISVFGSKIAHAPDDASLEGLGKAVWTLCLCLTAIDIGIVQRFGVEAGAHFVSRCCDSDLIESLWDNLELGPLITSNAHNATRLDIKRAFYRLTALLLTHFSLSKCLSFVKVSCDPVENLGDDVSSVLAYKDPKTFLQELLQASRGSPPSYSCERAPDTSDRT
jgi:hypothetical protein